MFSRRKKGFTLIELIIVLALLIVVLGAVYSFFLSNTKSINSTEVNSDLQRDAETIINSINKNLMEAKSINIILDSDGSNSLNKELCNISKIEVNLPSSQTAVYEVDDTNKIYFNGNILGENIESINISTLDSQNFQNTRAVKVVLTLSKDKGGEIYKYSISSSINFRNSDALS